MRKAMVAFFALMVALPSAAHALRCDDGLISSGDKLYELEDKCGAPDRHLRMETDEGGTAGHLYYYEMGYGKRPREVIIRSRTVVDIRRADD